MRLDNNPNQGSAASAQTQTIDEALREACASEGVAYKDCPANGRWHRADITDDPHGKGDASIKIFTDGEGGIICNWKNGGKPVFFWARADRALTQIEREARRRRVEAERAKAEQERQHRWEEAADKARAEWESLPPAPPEMPQLAQKNVQAHDARATPDGRLATPIYGPDDRIQSIQYRHADGQKRNFPHSRMEGGFWWIGTPDKDYPILVATSFTTAASIYEAVGEGHRVYISYGDGNLEAVARMVQARHGGRRIALCGDDDLDKPGNPGRTKAGAAGRALGLPVAFPDFGPDRPRGATDFNDLHLLAGLETVATQIKQALDSIPDFSGFKPEHHTPETFGDATLPDLPEPLQNLPAKLADDLLYPFRPDVLRALVLIEESNAYGWNAVKSQTKAAGVVLRDLSAAMTAMRKNIHKERLTARRRQAEEWAEKQRAAAEVRQDAADDTHHGASRAGQYQIMHGAIHRNKETHDGDIPIKLCNFVARIVVEVMRDDGASVESYFIIEGWRASGAALGRTEVPFSEFARLAWVTDAWGNLAWIEAGVTNRDHLRAAIQQLSGEVPRRTVYGHTGWRSIDGEWLYLHRAGALGADGNQPDIEVDAGAGHMLHYRLPDPSADIKAAVRASLMLLDIAPSNPPFGACILSAIYRAPLAECASIDVSLFLSGQTGAMKSEVSALALQHFGSDFGARAIPGNWTDTPTDLEMKAHAAKDAIFVVDDFKPNGRPKAEADRMHSLSDRIFRGVGNGASRGRRTANLKQRPDYPARGFVVASGEDLPRGQSCRARLLIAEARRGDVNTTLLTQLQQAGHSGLLAQAMAGYIQWLAPQLPELKATLKAILIAERSAAIQAGLNGDHDRVPDNAAQFIIGARFLALFAKHVGATDDAEALFERVKAAIYQTARAQGEHLADQDEIHRFFALLSAAIASGRAHAASIDSLKEPVLSPESWGWRLRGQYHEPQGNLIGWTEDTKLYLDADSAFAAVAMMARDQGESFTMTQGVLWKRFADRGLLIEQRRDTKPDGTPYLRLKTERRIGGKKHTNLVCVSSENLAGSHCEKKSEKSETAPLEAASGVASGCLRSPKKTGDSPETAQKIGDTPAGGAGQGIQGFVSEKSETRGHSETAPETAQSLAGQGIQRPVSDFSDFFSPPSPAENFKNNTHLRGDFGRI